MWPIGAGDRRVVDGAAYQQRMSELHAEASRVAIGHIRQPNPFAILEPGRGEGYAAARLGVANPIRRPEPCFPTDAADARQAQ